MELLTVNNDTDVIPPGNNIISLKVSSPKSFIEANTIECDLEDVTDNHIIPVYIKDNEPLISPSDFINTMMEVVTDSYRNNTILKPNIRLSHPIKGRTRDAKNKAANELLEHEKTLYYERMAFVIDIPSIHDEIDGNELVLSVGGVKAFNQDNLYGKKDSDQHFKLFIGFQNRVCTNLCVWTDGFRNDVKVTSLGELKGVIRAMIEQYNAVHHLYNLKSLMDYSLTEQQFALLIGKLRMYYYLPKTIQNTIPNLSLNDSQITTVLKDYYRDESFCRSQSGDINLWRLYNLLTGANKSSYIDNFLERSVNAFHFTERLKFTLMNQSESWFLN